MPQSPLVYVVDDNESVRDSLAALLESYGMDVRLYPSAHAFLTANGGVENGCLVADLHMPEMTGLELLEHMQQHGPFIPAIIITGRGDPALRQRAMQSKATAFFDKPIAGETLAHAITSALGNARHPAD